MIGPNLSDWAIRSRPLTIYFMLIAIFAGIFAFLGLANADITWNKNGFSFRTHLAPLVRSQSQDSYTRAEMRDLLRKVLDESESRSIETNYMMMQRMLDTIEQERRQERRSDLVLMKNEFIRGRRNN